LAVSGDYLVVASCSVGRTDKNLWLCKIMLDAFRFLDSVNLESDQNLSKVFDFDVRLTNAAALVPTLGETIEEIFSPGERRWFSDASDDPTWR
jgi:hypothetical protein